MLRVSAFAGGEVSFLGLGGDGPGAVTATTGTGMTGDWRGGVAVGSPAWAEGSSPAVELPGLATSGGLDRDGGGTTVCGTGGGGSGGEASCDRFFGS